VQQLLNFEEGNHVRAKAITEEDDKNNRIREGSNNNGPDGLPSTGNWARGKGQSSQKRVKDGAKYEHLFHRRDREGGFVMGTTKRERT